MNILAYILGRYNTWIFFVFGLCLEEESLGHLTLGGGALLPTRNGLCSLFTQPEVWFNPLFLNPTPPRNSVSSPFWLLFAQ